MADPDRERDLRFYRRALEEAEQGYREGGLPIGAALVRGEDVLGTGHNRRVQHGDPTAHAEIDCLRSVGRLSSYEGTTLYTTLTPCFLCSGAVVLFHIPSVVIGETTTYGGEGSLDLLRRRGVRVVDLNDDGARTLLGRFIEERPEVWLEDTGRS